MAMLLASCACAGHSACMQVGHMGVSHHTYTACPILYSLSTLHLYTACPHSTRVPYSLSTLHPGPLQPVHTPPSTACSHCTLYSLFTLHPLQPVHTPPSTACSHSTLYSLFTLHPPQPVDRLIPPTPIGVMIAWVDLLQWNL